MLPINGIVDDTSDCPGDDDSDDDDDDDDDDIVVSPVTSVGDKFASASL
jgi:hypothetical protein